MLSSRFQRHALLIYTPIVAFPRHAPRRHKNIMLQSKQEKSWKTSIPKIQVATFVFTVFYTNYLELLLLHL